MCVCECCSYFILSLVFYPRPVDDPNPLLKVCFCLSIISPESFSFSRVPVVVRRGRTLSIDADDGLDAPDGDGEGETDADADADAVPGGERRMSAPAGAGPAAGERRLPMRLGELDGRDGEEMGETIPDGLVVELVPFGDENNDDRRATVGRTLSTRSFGTVVLSDADRLCRPCMVVMATLTFAGLIGGSA